MAFAGLGLQNVHTSLLARLEELDVVDVELLASERV